METYFIGGDTYTAEFITYPKIDNEDEYADAVAVVKPPIDVANIQGILGDLVIGGVEITEYAKTASASILDFCYKIRQEGGATTEHEAFELMKSSLEGIISRLNDIETGNFPNKKGHK